MKKEYRIAFRSILEVLALGGIKVDTALRRISAVIEITEAEKFEKISGLGRCTKRPLAA